MDIMMQALKDLKLLQLQTSMESGGTASAADAAAAAATHKRGLHQATYPTPPNHVSSTSCNSCTRNSFRREESDTCHHWASRAEDGPSNVRRADWTACLLSAEGRKRQPIVLGDNSFADLITDWIEAAEPPSEKLPSSGSSGGVKASSPLESCKRLFGMGGTLQRKLSSLRPGRKVHSKAYKVRDGEQAVRKHPTEQLKAEARKCQAPYDLFNSRARCQAARVHKAL